MRAVLIIDMLRAFLEEGNPLYIGEQGRKIIPNVQRLIQQELTQGSKVYFICDSHDPDDLEFEIFPPHSIRGTKETEIIPELSNYSGEIILKNRYSSFYGIELDNKLKELNPESLIICGVLTDICILHTVADARNRDYKVTVMIDCVASTNDEIHNFALMHMHEVLGAALSYSVS